MTIKRYGIDPIITFSYYDYPERGLSKVSSFSRIPLEFLEPCTIGALDDGDWYVNINQNGCIRIDSALKYIALLATNTIPVNLEKRKLIPHRIHIINRLGP